jgi:uncharacterized protein
MSPPHVPEARRPWRGRVVRWSGVLILLAVAAYLVISPRVAERFVFFPDRTDPGPAPAIGSVEGVDVDLTTDDGVRIHGWWWEVEPGAPAIVFFHGNAGTIAIRLGTARGLVDRGVSVFLMEYRGYGRSEGRPTEEGILEDGLAARSWVVDRVGDPRRVVLHGRSLGGFVAAGVAARTPVGGVILESSFTSLRDMARAVYPFVPAFLFRRLDGHFDNLAALEELEEPVLVIHGDRDAIVPAEMGRRLHRAAGEPRHWLLVPGAGHNDLPMVGGDAYFERVVRFVHEVVEAAIGDAPDGAGG